MKKLILVFSALIVPVSFTIGQIITTVAGSAAPNNVQATSIGMEIFGAVADKHGNLYVSDASNSVVRKINLSTGVATIIAGTGNYGYSGDGGPATSASLAGPESLALDTAGNLYMGDGFVRIREVNIKTGIITTVAGNGTYGYGGDGNVATSAELAGQDGICFDKNNNMYLGELGNARVREVNAVTHIITTIAGTGTDGYNGDNIAATAAKLDYPTGVCVDDSGNVFITEEGCRVRKVNGKTGIISTIAGNGTYAYNGDNIPATTAELWAPLSIELDKAGNLYIADWGNNRVRKIDTSTGIITTIAGNGIQAHSGDGGLADSAELDNSYCVTLDTLNNIYIVEGYNPVLGYNVWIRKVDAATQDISTIVGNGSADYTGDGIAATAAQLAYPSGLAVNAAGNIYVADEYNNRIREINGGIISTYGGNGNWGFMNNMPANSAELFAPSGIALDKTGNMFIADTYNDRIREINLNDTMSLFAGNGYGSPYQGSYNGNGLAKYAELYFPSDVAVDDSGNVFIADTYNQRVREVGWKTGVLNTIAGNGTAGYNGDSIKATSAELDYPAAVAVDDSDNVYISDLDNNRIRKITHSTGMISTVAGNGTAGYAGDGHAATLAELSYPEGIALDVNGALYIADTYNNCIRKVNPATHIITTLAGVGLLGFSGDGGLATSAELNEPANIAFDDSGNMYIADTYNNRIRKVSHVVKLGINEIARINTQVAVYPNPSNGNFTIQPSAVSGQWSVEVFNMLGEKVYAQLNTQNPTFNINLSSQPNGVYLYRVIAEDGSLIGEGKLIIQK